MKWLCALLLHFAVPMCAVAQGHTGRDIPRHLAIARELVDNIKPDDNRYVLGGQFIAFPADGPSSRYAVRADCSGFLLALFARAGYRTRLQMVFLDDGPRRKRPRAEDFLHSIEQEKGYQRVRTIEDIRPGDLLAHAMLLKEDQKQTGTTGHVFLLDSAPKPIAARRPIVAGTRQFELSIIDSNEEHVGADDSRLTGGSGAITGLGRGTIRIYGDANGELVGWARTFPNANRFFSYSPRFPSDTKLRRAAIGRLVDSGT